MPKGGSKGVGGGSSTGGVLRQKLTPETNIAGIQLDTPLRYGEKDPYVSGAVRRTIENWEKKRRGALIEFSMCVDADGNELGESRGNRGSVQTPTRRMVAAEVFSHNHPRPRDSGELGGTFSVMDIETLWEVTTRLGSNLNTMRATAMEGTYSLTMTPRTVGTFVNYYRNAESDARARRNVRIAELNRNYINNRITSSEYFAGVTSSFNRMLVELHEALISGQSQYNYQYTLERNE